MKVSDCMKCNVVSIPATLTIAEAASIFVARKVGLLPVVDEQDRPIGIVSLRDLLELELPDFVNFISDVDFVHDFGAVETTRPTPEELDRPVTTLMQPVITVEENCGLLRAYALMLQLNLLDMLIVNGRGELVGITSWVDIGTAILSAWQPKGNKEE
ncbi:MAG: CBS domain-containing protein [Anaerolineales bacterium]|nr:CBS domain-containing protein [Anaerolineales bacterium]